MRRSGRGTQSLEPMIVDPLMTHPPKMSHNILYYIITTFCDFSFSFVSGYEGSEITSITLQNK